MPICFGKKLDEVGWEFELTFGLCTSDLMEVTCPPTRQPAQRSTPGVFSKKAPLTLKLVREGR